MKAVAMMTPEPKYFANLPKSSVSHLRQSGKVAIGEIMKLRRRNVLEGRFGYDVLQPRSTGDDGEERAEHGTDVDDEAGRNAEGEEVI